MKCIICEQDIEANAFDPRWVKGNNAEPVASGQCCDVCNDTKVVPARMMDYGLLGMLEDK